MNIYEITYRKYSDGDGTDRVVAEDPIKAIKKWACRSHVLYPAKIKKIELIESGLI